MAMNQKQITLTIGAETATIEVGPYAAIIPHLELFTPPPIEGEKHLIQNVRMAMLLSGSTPAVGTKEFTDILNVQNRGIELAKERVYVTGSSYEADGSITIRFGATARAAEAAHTITIQPADLAESAMDSPEVVVTRNLRAWLRKEGVTSVAQITTPVRAKLAAQAFWVAV